MGFNNIVDILRTTLDILIVTIIIYAFLNIIKNNSKTLRIFKGIIFLVILDFIARYFGLSTLQFLTQNMINYGFLAVIIIFQPEIRTFLERLGRSNMYSRLHQDVNQEKMVNELYEAVKILSYDKTGALITIERDISLEDYIETGVLINSDVNSILIRNIFTPNTPLHDGAIVIKNNYIVSASTYFPPSNVNVLQKYGARHRAALGISEITDSITIVVSEETGKIRIAVAGSLERVSIETFSQRLTSLLNNEDEVVNDNE